MRYIICLDESLKEVTPDYLLKDNEIEFSISGCRYGCSYPSLTGIYKNNTDLSKIEIYGKFKNESHQTIKYTSEEEYRQVDIDWASRGGRDSLYECKVKILSILREMQLM